MGKLHHAPISIDPLLYGYTYKVAPCRQGKGVLCYLQSAAFLCLMDTFYPVDIMVAERPPRRGTVKMAG